MKYTLLDLTQVILSSMDSDEINSISDTPEALQVVSVIKTTYFDIINRAELPSQFDMCKLEPSGDPALPVVMFVPDNIEEILWIKYDRQTINDPGVSYQPIQAIPLYEFYDRQGGMDVDQTTISYIITIDSEPYTFYCRKDIPPSCYTVTNDRRVIFDSFDILVDTTLQKSKTLCYGQKSITWSDTDTFVPALDDKQFSLLLNEAKALCFNELKQQTHVTAERNAHRGWIDLGRNKRKVNTISDFRNIPKYGRGGFRDYSAFKSVFRGQR